MSDEAPKALEHFFTVEEYVCLPGDRTAWYAINKASGIMCPGRDTLDLALQDAEALNAAVKRATESLRARVVELEKIEADAKAAGMLDEKGKLRKVLGTLPITADGCVVGQKAYLWNMLPSCRAKDDDKPMRICYKLCPITDPDVYTDGPIQMWSTREAAEAAWAAKEGGGA